MKKARVSIADPPPIREWEEAAAKLAAQYIKGVDLTSDDGVDLTSDDLVTLYRQISNLNLWQLRAVAKSFFKEVLRLQILRGDDQGLIKEALKKIQQTRNDRRRGAQVMLSRDPTRAAMGKARVMYVDWQAGRTKHESGAGFARYVVQELPDITATKSVERWVTKWRRESEKLKSEM